MSDKIYSINEIKTIVAPIAVRYDVDRVYLFGSYARGEADSKSDLDFIIDKGRLRGLRFAGLWGDLQECFNKKVDLITSSSLNEYEKDEAFNRKIERDMVVIYEQ
ncbi:MAG: nucleotidyltransferase domain-containing protein [Oscillospiraceae bacterium]|jgi:predicted nucleotidyltransferase|nr:nucleotidyltransferase domain-containing protein [Oscillospiraceae bacterium]